MADGRRDSPAPVTPPVGGVVTLSHLQNRARFATSPLRWPGPQRHLHGAPDQAGSFARRSAFRVPHQPSVPVGFRSVSGIAAAEAAATAIKVFSFMVVGLCPSRLYPLSCWILRPTTGLLKGRSSPVLNKWLVRSRALGRQLSMNLFICAQHERSKMSLLAAMLPWVSKTRLCGGGGGGWTLRVCCTKTDQR